MLTFQKLIQSGKRLIPRGWSPFLRLMAKIIPKMRNYPALLKNGDTLYINLEENMCHGYFYFGEVSDEQYTDAFFKKVVDRGDTFLDIGANVGYYTRFVRKKNVVRLSIKEKVFEPYKLCP